MRFNFHIDPGHGWMEVPFDLLVKFGIERKISHYSYRDWETCYLEEDCDATIFIDAWKKYHCEDSFPTIPVLHDLVNSPPCFIRELPKYYV